MRAAAMVLTALLASFPAHAQDTGCDRWLQGFSMWEEMVRGRLVEKVDYFDLQPIDANGGFEGIALSYQASRQLRRPSIRVAWTGENGSGERVYAATERNGEHTLFTEFDTREVLSHESAGKGRFTVTLLDGERLICEASKPMWAVQIE